jgi:conjugal transfer pilus assembly protein TraB
MTELSPTARAKRKQVIFMVAILTGVLVLSGIGVYLTEDSKQPTGTTRTDDIKTKSYIAPGEKIDPQDAWRGVSDTRLNTVENKLSSLETENRELKRKLGEKEKSAPTNSAPEHFSDADLDKRLADYEKSVEKPRDGYPPGTPGSPEAGQSAPMSSTAASAKAGQGRPQGAGQVDPQAAPGGILTVRLGRHTADANVKGLPAVAVATSPNDARTANRTTQTYLPSGMFGQAVMLSGLDAPTGGQAQSNPHPVLLQLLDLAVLPNRYRYDWDKCLITAAGYGDLSSERGYIRTESLSCVSKDGRVLDVPIKGYIVGEDGKAGMRGRLVSKQGQVLGNALLAGVVSGIGSGLERSSSIQSVSPLGSTSSIKPGAEFQSGVGAGTGKALDRLANYYIQLAEKMFPVIEIDAARVVDVVLTQGVNVDVATKND